MSGRIAKFASALRIAIFSVVIGVPASANVGAGPTGSPGHIALPPDNDDYGKLVARAATHDQSLDFRAMRFAWLKSAARNRGNVDDLQKAMFDVARAGDDQKVRDAAESLLSADYVDMFGQKYLRQSCTRLHDSICAGQAEFMEFGLLNSITRSGDGKTCATGWEVVEVKEEYFVLAMLGTSVKMQSLQMGKPSCDVMNVTDENGKDATYFFRIDAVLEDEASMLGGATSK